MSTYIISTRPTTMPTPGWTPRERPASQPRPLLRGSPGPRLLFLGSPRLSQGPLRSRDITGSTYQAQSMQRQEDMSGKSFQRSPSTCLMNCQVLLLSRRQKIWALPQMLTWRELRLSSHPPRTRHRHLRSSGTPRSSRSGETSPNT